MYNTDMSLNVQNGHFFKCTKPWHGQGNGFQEHGAGNEFQGQGAGNEFYRNVNLAFLP